MRWLLSILRKYIFMKSSKRKSVCILSNSEVARDQRILKQIRAFQKLGLQVIAIGHGSCSGDIVSGLEYHTLKECLSIQPSLSLLSRLIRLIRFIKKPSRKEFERITNYAKQKSRYIFLLLGRIIPQAYRIAYWLNSDVVKLRNIAASSGCDFFHANDIMALPAALAASSGAPVVFDAHEYAPGELHLKWRERHLINPYNGFLCRHYIPCVSMMTTVCDSIAKMYKKETGITPIVIRNVPPYKKINYRPTNPIKIRLIHHGGAMPERYLEDMIRLVGLLPKQYTLTFMLTLSGSKSASYVDMLRDIAEDEAPGRVIFAQPVPYSKLLRALRAFDIGVFMLRGDRNINYKYALPNKLFEFIMAGLCIAISPSVEMVKIVNKYDCGIVAEDDSPRSLASAISRLSPKDVDDRKSNSLCAAKELNAEIEMKKLIAIYDELFKKNKGN